MNTLMILPLYILLGSTPLCKDDFKYIEVSVQRVLPGIRGAGISVSYYINYLPSSKKQPAEMVDMWTESRHLEVKKRYSAGDTIRCIASYRLPGERDEFFKKNLPEPESPVKDTILPPFKFTGEALLHYRIGKKEKYFDVKAIKKLPPLAMP